MSEKKIMTAQGIPLYSYILPDSHSFVLSFFVRTGVMTEPDGYAGISHFLEHVGIRSVNGHMGGRLYSVLDSEGLEFNASTYSEMVQFYVVGSPDHFRTAAQIMSRLLLPIELGREEIDAERGRIKAEIRESGDRTSLASFTQEQVFAGTPLSRPITGRIADLNSIKRAQLEEYRKRVMSKNNCFFYLTGKASEDDISYLLSLLESIPVIDCPPFENLAVVPSDFGKRGGGVYVKNADFTKVRFTFDVDMSLIDVPSLDLLHDIILGGYSSDFFVELSEKRALFYDLSGSVERYLNIGTFSFSYELRESKLYEAIATTVDILKRYKENELEEERMMKAGYVDNAPMLLDDPRELNFTFAYDNHIMELGYSSLEDRIAAYKAITPARLMECARCIFTPDNLTLTVKGRKKTIDCGRIQEELLRLGHD